MAFSFSCFMESLAGNMNRKAGALACPIRGASKGVCADAGAIDQMDRGCKEKRGFSRSVRLEAPLLAVWPSVRQIFRESPHLCLKCATLHVMRRTVTHLYREQAVETYRGAFLFHRMLWEERMLNETDHADRVYATAQQNSAAASSPIVASWRRCMTMHNLAPEEARGPTRLSGNELSGARERSIALISEAHDQL